MKTRCWSSIRSLEPIRGALGWMRQALRDACWVATEDEAILAYAIRSGFQVRRPATRGLISQGRASARTRSLQIFGSAIRNPQHTPPYARDVVRRRRCNLDHLQCTVTRGRLDRVADAYLSASLDGTGIAGRERAAVPRSDAALDSRANHAPRTPILPRWTKPQNQSPQAIAPLIRETKCASDRKNLSSALRGMPTVSDILMLATRATGQSSPR